MRTGSLEAVDVVDKIFRRLDGVLGAFFVVVGNLAIHVTFLVL